MCINARDFSLPKFATAVAEMGFRWVIIDEIAFGGKIGLARNDTIYSMKGLPELVVFFKERPFSAGITYGSYPGAKPFFEALKDKFATETYMLTGTDGEVYGHHRPGQERLLLEVFQAGNPKTCTISELLKLFTRREEVSPLPSSWSTWEDEMAQGIPYPQWNYPGHELHQLQRRLTYSVIELLNQVSQNAPAYNRARYLLDEGLHSCQYWWASCRPWWDTGMIEWGAMKLRDAIGEIRDSLPAESVNKTTDLFNLIVAAARNWQESGKAKELKEQYLEQHKQVSTELTFGQ